MSEFKHVADILAPKLSDERVKAIFEEMDADHSGTVEWSEFVSGFFSTDELHNKKFIQSLFAH